MIDQRKSKAEISDALIELRPGAMWSVGDTYESINWMDKDLEKPSIEEVEDKLKELQLVCDNNQYKRDRKKEYPSIQDQLDLLFHGGLEGWKEEIQKVKDKFPKPLS